MVDAGRDLGRLLLQVAADESVVGVEAGLLVDVADPLQSVADRLLERHLGARRHLPDHAEEALGNGGLARHSSAPILLEHRVEDGVGDLVADLVGMAFSDRLGCEQIGAGVAKRSHGVPFWGSCPAPGAWAWPRAGQGRARGIVAWPG